MGILAPLVTALGIGTALAMLNRKRTICVDCEPTPSSDLDAIPSRAMTVEQARVWLDLASHASEISLFPAFIPTRVSLHALVSGVSFQYIGRDRVVNDVDPRFAVFLVRLARRLKTLFQITKLAHLGIFPGNASHPLDCHNQGRAIDFSGVTFEDGTSIDVLKNWGEKPAPYNLSSATVTSYRLTESDNGYTLFKAVYDFASEEGADSTAAYVKDELKTVIGEHSYIVTPDHPTPALRAAHQNHMHMQIGPTNIS